MAPKRASASPAPTRMTPRKTAGAPPKRLGVSDGFGDGAARAWASPAAPPKTPTEQGKALFDEKTTSAGIVGFGDVAGLFWSCFFFAAALREIGPLMPYVKMPPEPYMFAALMVAVASNHLVYAFVWLKTPAFKKLCKQFPLKLVSKKPVVIFEFLVLFFKFMVQQLGFLVWAAGSPAALYAYVVSLATSPVATLAPVTPTKWLAGFGLIIAGQVLNAAIYKAIGRDGVYYGFKLGAKVPWSTAFPFNAGFRHPQYVGGYASQLGVLLLATTPANLEAGMLPLAAWWGVCYVVTSIVESFGDNDK